MQDISPLLQVAQHAAREAGKAIMKISATANLSTETKTDQSPVTIGDKASDRIIRDVLGATGLPVVSEEGNNIAWNARKNWASYWLIDPLDGTKEFINGFNEFTVNIALIERNSAVAGVVYLPSENIMYYGAKETGVYKKDKEALSKIPALHERMRFEDIATKEHVVVAGSRSHFSDETNEFLKQLKSFTVLSIGSSLKFMLLLENKVDIYPRFGKTMEWDTAAAHAILNAANRGVYHVDLQSELSYNKPDPGNPFFIAF
jgi:3'(2'), 5'-bisphosphate nucleotidase